MTRTPQRTPRTSLASWAIGLSVAAESVICALSLTFTPVDPVRDPVSDYAFHRGARTGFVLAILLVLAGAVALATAARRTGLPADRATTVLFGLWVIGLMVVLVFPGNTYTGQSTVHGSVHRLGGAVLFGSLPLACTALAHRLAGEPGRRREAVRLRGFAAGGLLTAAAFGATQFFPRLPEGLLERIALTAELTIIVGVATAIRSAAR